MGAFAETAFVQRCVGCLKVAPELIEGTAWEPSAPRCPACNIARLKRELREAKKRQPTERNKPVHRKARQHRR